MFDYIRGEFVECLENTVVVDVNGIGYRMVISSKSAGSMPKRGDLITVYTHLYIREDVLDLYGFADIEERAMFLKLINISGVGPKAAISILSALSVVDFALAVIGGDSKAITQAQGIGAKLASRIILELKDKVDGDILSSGSVRVTSPALENEAVEALVALGYTSQEASTAIVAASAENDATQEAIRKALGQLMRG